MQWKKHAPDTLDPREIAKLGIKITSPKDDERVTSKTRITVISDKPMPDGYELHVLRGYPRVNGIAPNAKVRQTPNKLEWVALDFDIGGISNETRTIEAWLVGPDGAALLKNWEDNHAVIANANRQLKNLAQVAKRQPEMKWLPPIVTLTADMHRCQSVVVVKA